MFLKIYIYPSLFISPFITISCNSWFSIWMMMEFNLMSFIPLIIFYNKFYKELSMKYFLIQTISSSIMILSANSMMFINFNLINNTMMFNLMLNLSLIMKIGASPFHNWFINMMKNMDWISCLILSTWQKFIPMIIIMYSFNWMLMLMTSLLSAITGTAMSLNYQSLRIIMGYSSINHMSWMLINCMISEWLWIFYFISYSLINMLIMLIFNKFKIFYINQLFNMNNFKINKLHLFLNLVSISGMPPLFGFSMKWLSIYFISSNYLYLIIMFMIMMSMIMFLVYTRLIISFMIVSKLENKLILINKFMNFNKFNIFFILSFNLNLWLMNIWLM